MSRFVGLVLLSAALAGCHTKSSTPADEGPYRNTDEVELSAEVRSVLESSDSFKLLALHPSPDTMRKEEESPAAAASLHGYEILGSYQIDSATDRRSAVEAIYEGIVANPGIAAGCFNPRHGVVAKKGSDVVDLVICLECLQIQVYLNGTKVDGVLTTEDPGTILTSMLNKQGIEIHKGH